MSINVLKRKSRRYQATVSGRGKDGFSLNGGYRVQGWVGQDVRGRTIVGTPFRGALPKGSGGCCGTYTKNIVGNTCCTNDPSIIKRSTMNTPGFIESSYMHPTGVLHQGCSTPNAKCGLFNVVKDFSPENHSQSSRIDKLKKKNASCVVLKSDAGLDRCLDDCKSQSYHIGGKKYVRTMYSKNYNKLPMSSSQYQQSSLMANKNLPTPACKQAYPPALSHNRGTCQINVNTPEQAKAAGVLPDNWMTCVPRCENPGNAVKLPVNSQRITVHTNLSDYTAEELGQLFGQYVPG